MWTMWFIYYMHIKQLYSVYSNIGFYTGQPNASLVINRMEVGLHQPRRKRVNIHRLLNVWKEDYVKFPAKPVRLDWDGRHVPDNRQYK